MALERLVDHSATAYPALEISEVGDDTTEVLGIAREAEVGIDVVANPDCKLVDRLARAALRLDRRGAAKKFEKLARRLVAVFQQDVAHDLYR